MRGKLPAYLCKDRHGLYHFRARIPKEFRLHFNGKVEIKRSLKTDSYRETVKLARAYRVQFDERMAELTKGVFNSRVLVLEGEKRITLPHTGQRKPLLLVSMPIRLTPPKPLRSASDGSTRFVSTAPSTISSA